MFLPGLGWVVRDVACHRTKRPIELQHLFLQRQHILSQQCWDPVPSSLFSSYFLLCWPFLFFSSTTHQTSSRQDELIDWWIVVQRGLYYDSSNSTKQYWKVFFFLDSFSLAMIYLYSFISRRSMEWFRRGSDLNKYRWGHPMTGSRHWRKTRVLLMRWWRDEKAQKARELTYHTAWPRSILLLDASIQPSIQHIEPAAPRLDLQRAFPPAALCSFHHISTPTIRAGSAIVFFLPHPLIRDSFISFRYSLNGDRGYWSSSHYLTLVFRPNSIHH